MKSKHTPGPWRTNKLHAKGNQGKFVIANMIEYIGCIDAVEGAEKNEANARIIAAAPDLLLCCQVLLSYFDGGEVTITWADGMPGNLDAIREAVKKATGED